MRRGSADTPGSTPTFTRLFVLFKRSRPPVPPPTPPNSSAPVTDDALARLLDVVGALSAAYIRGCFDLPRFPAADARDTLEAWRRHALLGAPVGQRSDTMATGGTADPMTAETHGEPASVGVTHRDWRGVTSAFAEHRATERQFVEKALADLRDALWVCVDRSYQAFMADVTADGEHQQHLARVRGALDGLETGAVKTEITQAMAAMEQVTRSRHGAQQALYRELTSRVEQLGQQLDDARRQGETDALTGLGNRLAFDRAVARQMALHGLSGAPLCVIMVDLDHLKPINDTHGHHTGDQALLAVTKVLHRTFLGEGDQLCRIGGDEFAVVLPNSALALGERLVERFRQGLAQEPWPHADGGLPLSASAGVAEWRPGEEASHWLARADAAMYAQKSERRRAA